MITLYLTLCHAPNLQAACIFSLSPPAMTYESSDILGGRPLDNGKSGETSMFFKLTGVAALGLFAWLAWFRGRVAFLKWKETRYKK